MAERQKTPDRRDKGRALRTTLLSPPFRLAAANDNRGPGWRWVGWGLLAVLAAILAVSWWAI